MTWINRLKMLVGVFAVFLLVLALTVALSHRKGETDAGSASMDAIEYPVGTDYSGTVIEQFVVQGDAVAAGDPIARIQSTQLLQDLDDDISVPDSEVFQVNDDGTYTVLSSVNGLVQEVSVQQGGYAAGGTTLATIAALDSLFVSAEFILDPKDFERIEQGARVDVTLPNDQQLAGTVESIEVATVDDKAVATATVDIDESLFAEQGGLMTPGTPVEATMQLRNDDLLATSVAELRTLISDVREALFA